MSQAAKAGSNAARRQAAAAAARRRRNRRWGLGSGLAIVAVLGVVLGLHFAPGSQTRTGVAVGIPAAGRAAPPGTFTTLTGQRLDVTSLRGHPTLLWFVSTWCSSCQAGTQAMAQNLAKLAADGVHVDEVELYADLGQSGPSMGRFSKVLAGPAYTNPDWTFGVSSEALTRTYDPQSYLDIYYLLDAKGQVTYVNSSPGATMFQLLQAAGNLT